MTQFPKSAPTYLTIANTLKSRIASGDRESGDKLPSINDMAAEWGVNRSMISRALKYLEDEGYVTTIQGKGTYVATPDTMPKEKSNKWKIFWSYAHKDDVNSGGAITRLREAIQAEYQLRTGDDDLDIFQDTKDLEWGADWRKTIDNNLAVTSFFVPVLSPTYLRSPSCLAELRTAITLFENLGYQEGICPIDFVECSRAFRDLKDDRLANLLGDTQRIIDFKALRYKGLDSCEYREQVAEMVNQLIAKREALLERQEEREDQFLQDVGNDEQSEGDLLSRIGAIEDTMAQLGVVTDLIGLDIESIGLAFNSNDMPDNMTPKQAIVFAASVAKKLEEPCNELEAHCSQYDEMIQVADDGLDAFLEFADVATMSGFDGDMLAKVIGMHASIADLLEKTENSFEQINSMRKMIRGFSKLSRVLTGPCGRIDAALGKIVSSRIVFEGWERKLGDHLE